MKKRNKIGAKKEYPEITNGETKTDQSRKI